eukprot:10421921-Ditylum_brightwellii.AAC.1
MNPVCFQIIVDYFNDLRFSSGEFSLPFLQTDREHQYVLGQMVKLFGIEWTPSPPDFVLNSTIVTLQSDQQILHSWLADDGFGGQPELLYRASRDGWESSQFHAKCDHRGPTITIIRTTDNYVFGGFCDTPWTSKTGLKYYLDPSPPKAFLFTLRCHSGMCPTKMRQKSESNRAVSHDSSCGPIFGRRNHSDIFIWDNANSNTRSYTKIGGNYTFPRGQTSDTFLT